MLFDLTIKIIENPQNLLSSIMFKSETLVSVYVGTDEKNANEKFNFLKDDLEIPIIFHCPPIISSHYSQDDSNLYFKE